MDFYKIYKHLVLISPYIEVIMRKLYWKYVSFFQKNRPVKAIQQIKKSAIDVADFEHILEALANDGVKKEDILIVHSSYDSLEHTNLSPNEIIDKLLDFVGPKGTIAMPVIRRYKDTPKYDMLLKEENNRVRIYDVQTSRVTSGLLPYCMLKREGSYVSRFPLNPLVAIGYHAKDMMIHNIEGELPSAHGPNSAWKFCLDHHARIVGLGVNVALCNTMTHVAEEAFDDWPISNWYKKSDFIIKDKDFECNLTIKERRLEKSLLHYAEFNLSKDIIKKGILKESIVDGIRVGFIDAETYISFLRNHKHKGYPYY